MTIRSPCSAPSSPPGSPSSRRTPRSSRGPTSSADDLHAYLSEPRWYQGLADAPKSIAYFSPEFGIAAALPQYSGGPRHPGRRSPQERLRPRRAHHRRGPLLSRGLFSPGDLP
ncbi:MAG: DUF3417 domain-containing protein [Galbitalea sp.]